MKMKSSKVFFDTNRFAFPSHGSFILFDSPEINLSFKGFSGKMKFPSGKKIREMIPFHQLHAAMPLFSPAPRALGSGAPMWLVRHAPTRWRTKPRYQVHVGLDVLSEAEALTS